MIIFLQFSIGVSSRKEDLQESQIKLWKAVIFVLCDLYDSERITVPLEVNFVHILNSYELASLEIVRCNNCCCILNSKVNFLWERN